MSSMVCKVFTF